MKEQLPSHGLIYTSAAAVFLGLFDLSAGFSFYLFEISLIAAALFMAVYWLQTCSLNPICIWNRVFAKGKSGGVLYILLMVYILWDLVGIVYSPIPLIALKKYPGVFVGIILAALMLTCLYRGFKYNLILIVTAAAGLFTSMFSLLNYCLIHIYPSYYALRITLRRDYNVFASVVFIGLSSTLYLIFTKEMPLYRKGTWAVLLCLPQFTVLVLSGSRRVIILLPVALSVLLAIWLINESKSQGNSYKPPVFISACALILLVAAFVSVSGMKHFMQGVYATHGESGKGGFFAGETAPEERYQTISDGSIFSKRMAIWSLAVQELKSYSPLEVLVGRGSSYDIHLYDITEDSTVRESYGDKNVKGQLSAHNFLLADILNGGIIKLSLSLSICITLIIYLWRLVTKKPPCGFFYALFAAFVMLGSFISNRYGFIYDRYFWLMSTGIVTELSGKVAFNKEVEVNG